MQVAASGWSMLAEHCVAASVPPAHEMSTIPHRAFRLQMAVATSCDASFGYFPVKVTTIASDDPPHDIPDDAMASATTRSQ